MLEFYMNKHQYWSLLLLQIWFSIFLIFVWRWYKSLWISLLFTGLRKKNKVGIADDIETPKRHIQSAPQKRHREPAPPKRPTEPRPLSGPKPKVCFSSNHFLIWCGGLPREVWDYFNILMKYCLKKSLNINKASFLSRHMKYM